MLTSAERKFEIDANVGWSKSTVGDICNLHSSDIVCTNSTPAIESKPADISEALASTEVPSIDNTIELTLALMLHGGLGITSTLMFQLV